MLTSIPNDFGSGGAGLAPDGASGEPALRDILEEHKEAIEEAQEDVTSNTAELSAHAKYLVVPADDPGDGEPIPVTTSASIGMTVAGSETNTLARPTFEGQRLVLYVATYTSGSRAITVTGGVNQTGNDTITLGAARDAIVLEAIKVGADLAWLATGNDGAALSTAGG